MYSAEYFWNSRWNVIGYSETFEEAIHDISILRGLGHLTRIVSFVHRQVDFLHDKNGRPLSAPPQG
jgi:hypothetical protein